jgi:hypothetical protein
MELYALYVVLLYQVSSATAILFCIGPYEIVVEIEVNSEFVVKKSFVKHGSYMTTIESR